MNLTDILHELVNEPQNEDLRKWFGKGKTGSSSGGGWDRYGSDGQKLGKKKYRAFLEKGLKDFKINAKHYDYRSNGAAEEKLFQLAK